jgi:hypothetical protein
MSVGTVRGVIAPMVQCGRRWPGGWSVIGAASRCFPAARPQTSSRAETYRRVRLDQGRQGRIRCAGEDCRGHGARRFSKVRHRTFDGKEALVMVRDDEKELPGPLGLGRWLVSHDSEGRHGHADARVSNEPATGG